MRNALSFFRLHFRCRTLVSKENPNDKLWKNKEKCTLKSQFWTLGKKRKSNCKIWTLWSNSPKNREFIHWNCMLWESLKIKSIMDGYCNLSSSKVKKSIKTFIVEFEISRSFKNGLISLIDRLILAKWIFIGESS